MNKVLLWVMLLSTCFSFAQKKTNLGDFSLVRVSDKIELKLIPASSNQIEISGSKAEEVVVNTKNDELSIRMKTMEVMQGGDVVVQLFYKDLKAVTAVKGATVRSKELLSSNNLKMKANSGAEISLKVEAEELEVKVSSGAEVNLTGKATHQKVTANSGGMYDGEQLKSVNTEVTTNAGGSADVFASGKVDATTRAGGEIHIWGASEVNEKKVMGGTVQIHK